MKHKKGVVIGKLLISRVGDSLFLFSSSQDNVLYGVIKYPINLDLPETAEDFLVVARLNNENISIGVEAALKGYDVKFAIVMAYKALFVGVDDELIRQISSLNPYELACYKEALRQLGYKTSGENNASEQESKPIFRHKDGTELEIIEDNPSFPLPDFLEGTN